METKLFEDDLTIPAKFVGTWDSIPGLGFGSIPGVFVINANGTGKVIILGDIVDISIKYANVGSVEKLKMITPNHGECEYDASIANNNLILANPVPDALGTTSQLAVYATMLSPYSKSN